MSENADGYIRKTYPVGWIRTDKPIAKAEREEVLKRLRRLLDRSMEKAT